MNTEPPIDPVGTERPTSRWLHAVEDGEVEPDDDLEWLLVPLDNRNAVGLHEELHDLAVPQE